MGKDSGGGGGTPNPNQTVTQLTDPAKLPYYTKLWDDTMALYNQRKTPVANPFGIWDTTPVGGGPISQWTDRNGKDMTVASVGPVDWSKYFGTGVQNPYAPAYLAEHPEATYQYQGLAGTKTAPGTVLNPTPVEKPATPVTTPTTTALPTKLFDPAALQAMQRLNTNTDGGAKAGGYVNPFASGGRVRHFDDGGDVQLDTIGAAPSTDTVTAPAAQGLDEASARNVFAGINTGVDENSQQYADAIKWATSTPGMTADKIREIALQNGQTLKGTNTEKATTTADTLSNSQAPSGVTSAYHPTDYSAQQVHGDFFNANQMAAPRDVNSPEYKQYQMQQAADINAQQNTANQMTKPDEAVAAQMANGPAQVSTDKFTDPGNVESYMNPYEKAATEATVSEMQRSFDKTKAVRDAQATQAGAFGGYRQGIENTEAQRNESQLEGNTRAQMANQAYQNAMQQYSTDAARKLAAQQSNQGAQTTYDVQNLTADQQTRLANLGMAVQVGQANLTAAQQTALANQATDLAAQQSNQSTATQTGLANLNANLTTQQQKNAASMQAQMANQAADLGVGQSNLGAAQQTAIANQANSIQGQIANQGASLQGNAQNQQAQQTANQQDIQAQLANIDNYYRNQGVQLTGAQLNAQLAQMQTNATTSQYATDANKAIQERGQDLNMSQFQTTTTQNMLAALNKQYGDIQNWPMAQLQAALAALKT